MIIFKQMKAQEMLNKGIKKAYLINIKAVKILLGIAWILEIVFLMRKSLLEYFWETLPFLTINLG